MNTKAWSVLQIINWAKEYFSARDVDSPRLTIELLLCHVLEIDRIKLYLSYERLLSNSELATLKDMIIRRAQQREPLQYIIGRTNFYGCNLFVDSSVLIPRPETEILVENVVSCIKDSNYYSVLDIGTGSGCIAIAIAKNCPNVNIVAMDISEEALKLATKNAAFNNITSIDFVRKDILSDSISDRKFDIIVSNPPYISVSEHKRLDAEVLHHEPTIALTDNSDGLEFYRHYTTYFRSMLNEQGVFFLEIAYNQQEDVLKIFSEYECEIINDYSGIPRIIRGALAHR